MNSICKKFKKVIFSMVLSCSMVCSCGFANAGFLGQRAQKDVVELLRDYLKRDVEPQYNKKINENKKNYVGGFDSFFASEMDIWKKSASSGKEDAKKLMLGFINREFSFDELVEKCSENVRDHKKLCDFYLACWIIKILEERDIKCALTGCSNRDGYGNLKCISSDDDFKFGVIVPMSKAKSTTLKRGGYVVRAQSTVNEELKIVTQKSIPSDIGEEELEIVDVEEIIPSIREESIPSQEFLPCNFVGLDLGKDYKGRNIEFGILRTKNEDMRQGEEYYCRVLVPRVTVGKNDKTGGFELNFDIDIVNMKDFYRNDYLDESLICKYVFVGEGDMQILGLKEGRSGLGMELFTPEGWEVVVDLLPSSGIVPEPEYYTNNKIKIEDAQFNQLLSPKSTLLDKVSYSFFSFTGLGKK